MTAEVLWHEFCIQKGIDENTPYEAWAFCGGGPAADELAELVLNGIKFGTASALDEYLYEEAEDEIPKIGDYSVILLDSGEAVCVLKDYDVYQKEFQEVSAFHGYSEGEEKRTLQAWREIHKRAFEPGLNEIERPLTKESMIICEKFTVEYIADTEITRKMRSKHVGLITAGELEQDLFLVEPSMEYANQIVAYRNEMLEIESDFDGCLSLKRMPDPKEWVSYCLNWGNPKRVVANEEIKGTLLMCIRKSDNKLVGMIQILHNRNTFAEKYAGDIGYSIRPSERKKGYAKWMLSHVIDYCHVLGIEDISISCLVENEASKKVILSNGGMYKDTVHVPKDNVDLERYVIQAIK